MTDYKQLCAELLRAMDEMEECEAVDWSLVKTRPLKMANQSMAEARAALSEPEPEGPTDEELAEFLQQLTYKEMSESSPFGAPSWDPDKEHQRELSRARAVLARWGK